MPRTTHALPSRASPVRTRLLGGNGIPQPDAPSADRLARMESVLISIQQSLAVQFQRIAAIQAQLDRAIADRPVPPTR